MSEGERLAGFSEMVRESSLKRLRGIPPEDRAWRAAPGQLSFVDVLKHLVDADKWMLAILRDEKMIPRAVIHPGGGEPGKWEDYLTQLENSGKEKAALLRGMSEEELSREVEDWEVLGKASKWLVLMRGNLDHEIHHRGAIQVMLNLRRGASEGFPGEK